MHVCLGTTSPYPTVAAVVNASHKPSASVFTRIKRPELHTANQQDQGCTAPANTPRPARNAALLILSMPMASPVNADTSRIHAAIFARSAECTTPPVSRRRAAHA